MFPVVMEMSSISVIGMVIATQKIPINSKPLELILAGNTKATPSEGVSRREKLVIAGGCPT
jgi:hypothetical protein